MAGELFSFKLPIIYAGQLQQKNQKVSFNMQGLFYINRGTLLFI